LALSLVEFDGARFEVVDRLVKEVGVRTKPRVLHDEAEVGAALGIWLEHDGQQVTGFGGDVVGEGQRGVDDVLVEQVDVVAVRVGGVVIKGEIAGEHGVEDDAAGPYIDGRADVGAF